MNHDMAALVGRWITDPEDVKSSQESEKTIIEFTDSGHLTYTIVGEDKDQKIFLTYRIESGLLVTNQPSHPREDQTPFSLTLDGKLVLEHGKQKSKYIRE